MNQKIKIATAFLCGAIFFSGISYASTGNLVAKLTNFKVTVNGKQQKLDNNLVSIDGRTYLSTRDVAKVTGFDVAFKSGVVSLTNDTPSTEPSIADEPSNNSNPKQSDFMTLPITKTFKDYDITVNSIELTETTAIINLTIKNNSSMPTSAEFSNRLFGYNYGIEGKQGIGGTSNVKSFPTPIAANSESTGTVEMKSGGLDADYFVFNVTVANQRDQPVMFLIKK
jgi:hypothetical protein